METKNSLTTSPKACGSSCQGGKGFSGALFSTRNVIIGVVAIAGLGLALGQNWLTFAAIAPLLFVVPCMGMMYMCMKGHGGDKSNVSPPAPSKKADIDTSAAAG
ncbi:hypothetical protein N185_34385 [Sinorhizobium sp. GW3]|nr:hypothetical protein N185_34385 [Sinorhizobium sp. GW3]